MNTVYTITDEDRETLREPLGHVVTGDELITELKDREYDRLICVGDRVSSDVADSDLDADLYVIDGRIEREVVDLDNKRFGTDRELTATNPAGMITEAAWNTTREAFAYTCSITLRIDGEEDLLALPAILFASPDSLIVYGDWQNGAVILEPDSELKQFAREMLEIPRFPRIIVGGTWDRFHAGHRYLLLAALENGDQVDIGVTTDTYVAEHGAHETESFEARKEHITTFLERFGRADDVNVLPIDDFRGNAVDAEQGVLMVTEDTLENAKKINQERLSEPKTPLKIAAVQRILADDKQAISSTRIRNNEITRNGVVLPE